MTGVDDLVRCPEGMVHDPAYTGRGWRYLAVGPYCRTLDDIGVHIARWDPARVLAEVEAKRRILDEHQPVHGYDPNGPVCSTCGEPGNLGDETAVVRWPCPTVRLLALPYADRAGYQAEWCPDTHA